MTSDRFRWPSASRLILAALCAGLSPLLSQTTSTPAGVLEGRVSHAANGAALANVRITVEGTGRDVVTGPGGTFRLAGLPPGEWRVTASYVGLEPRSATVRLEQGRGASLDLTLGKGDVVALQRFEVLEQREQNAQALALNQQRQSPNIKNVVARDEYPAGSDDNVADFLRFIPGVSVVYSGRAGTDASLRGLPSDTSGITMDGMELSGAFTGNTRTVSLLAVPTSNIGTVEVTKVPTPDLAANGLGGSINITTRSGFERTKPQLTYNVFTAFDPQYGLSLSSRKGPHSSMDAPSVRPSFEFGYLLPVNKSFSLSLSAANKLNYNTNPADGQMIWDLVQGFASVCVLRNSQVQLVTVRSGLLGADWKLGDKDLLKATISYRMRDADQGNNGLNITYGAGATGGATFTQGSAAGNGSLFQQYSWQNLVSHTTHALVKYSHLGDTWRIDASGSYSYSSFYFMPDYNIGYFGGATVTIPNLVIRGEGHDGRTTRAVGLWPTLVTARDRAGNAVSLHDGRLYSITGTSSAESGNQVDKLQAKLDLRRELRLGVPLFVQTGGSVTRETQQLYNWARNYNFRPTATPAERLAGAYDVIDTEYSAALGPMLGQRVQWVSPGKLFQLYRAKPDYFVLNEAAAHQQRVNTSKRLQETISALYFRADARLLNNRLWVVGGVRYERTADDGQGPLVNPAAQYVRNPNGTLARDAAGRFIPVTTDPLAVARLVYIERGARLQSGYGDWFPSLNASYNLKEDLVLRLGYANTIGRPNLPFIIPGATYSTITETSTRQTITVVNSRLQPWKANNYDLSLESYLIRGGFGSVGVFQKDLRNFFTSTTFPGTPELLERYGVFPAAGDSISYDLVTRANGGDARIRGFEFTYRQALSFLPHWARGAQVFINLTRSRLSGSTTADFTGFNPQTLSWGINFTRGRYAVKFSSTEGKETKRSAVATSATNPPGTYLWQGALRRHTLSVEYSLSRRLGLYASLGDFNAPGGYVIIQKQYAPTTPESIRTSRVTEWGQSAILGVKGEF